MRIALFLFGLFVLACGPKCEVELRAYTIPTYLDPAALDPAEGPVNLSCDPGECPEGDYESHAADWKALPCEDVCQKVMGARTTCEPMTKTPAGHYQVKCTVQACPGDPLKHTDWT